MWLSLERNGIVIVVRLPKGSLVAAWDLLLVGAVVTGASLAYAMVVPRRWMVLPMLSAAGGAAFAIQRLGTIVEVPRPAGVAGMAALLCGVGISAGYWLASASLSLYSQRDANLHTPGEPPIESEETVVVALSSAAPERYRVGRTTSHLRRLLDSGALTMPTSALPFVFLSERSRYRTVGDYLPARASTRAVIEQMQAFVSESHASPIVVAWSDGGPSLKERVLACIALGAREVVVVTLGADGSYPFREAVSDLETALEAGSARATVGFATSIWHSDALAARLVERILETTLDAHPDEVGVVLVGEGQPEAWEAFDQSWRERENYFNQRVRLLLTEHGVREQHVRTAWLEWQTPDVTEAVRHLAALGSTRIVVAPSTIPCATLSTAIDLAHMVASARVKDDVHTVILPPWGDDPAFASAAVDALRHAIVEPRRPRVP
jgi:protoheme ferro-lyase